MSRIILPTIAASRRRESGLILPSSPSLYLDSGNAASYPGTGSLWSDLSGYGNHATLVGNPVFSSVGGAHLLFDGVDDRGTIADSPSMSPTTGYSVVAWLSPLHANPTAAAQGILVKRNSSSSGHHFATFIFTSGALFADVPSSTFRVNSRPLFPPSGGWAHMAAVWSGASNVVRFYKNGAFANVATSAPGSVTDQTSNAIIGYMPNAGPHANFRCGVVLFYNRALNATEIRQTFDAFRIRYGVSVSSPTYLLAENFESGTTPAGWTGTGGANFGYVSVGPVEGSLVLLLQDDTQTAYGSFSDSAEVWIFARIRRGTQSTSTGQSLLSVNRSMTDPGARVSVVANSNSLNFHCGDTSTSIGAFEINMTHSFWLRYVKGTGSNAIAQLWVQTDGSEDRPASPTATITTGTSTVDVNTVFFSGSTAGSVIIDKVRVSASEIGSRPI